jgi:putative hydrolase of the HAD superfamily
LRDWLFFDVGSTLVDEGQALEDFVSRCVVRLSESRIPCSKEDYNDMLYRIATEGGDPIRESWHHFAPDYLERPKWSHEKEELYLEVPAILNQLKQQYHLGIIANQGENLDSRLERFGILNEFEIVVGSSDVGLYKPDVRIFQYALETAGIRVDRAIYIGDRVDNDILPAKMLGMRTVRMMQGLGQYGPEDSLYSSDWQLSNLEDLLQLTKKGFE